MDRQALSALNEASLRRYLSGQVASVLGSWTQNVTLNLLVYHLSGSAAILALLNFLLYGPQLVVAPVAGSRIRAENARRVTLCVLTASLILTGSLITLSALHLLSVPLILAHALAIGISSAIEVPARQVLLLTSLRDTSLTSNAVAMNTMVYNVAAWSVRRLQDSFIRRSVRAHRLQSTRSRCVSWRYACVRFDCPRTHAPRARTAACATPWAT